MPLSIAKIAPTAIAAAVVTWCCWPYLDGPGQGVELSSSAKVLQIRPSLLSPDIEPPTGRNPFRPLPARKTLSVKSLVSCLQDSKLWKKGILSLLRRPSTEPTFAAKPTLAAAKPSVGPGVPAGVNQGPSAEEECGRIARELVLSATYLQGDRRVALISGRVYEPGQALPISGLTQGPCTVAQILPCKVVLEYRRRTMELKYPDLAFMAPQKPIIGPTSPSAAPGRRATP